jgi:hypothetical protein
MLTGALSRPDKAAAGAWWESGYGCGAVGCGRRFESRGMPDVRATARWGICVRECLRQKAPWSCLSAARGSRGRWWVAVECARGSGGRGRPRECVSVATEGAGWKGRRREDAQGRFVLALICARDGRGEASWIGSGGAGVVNGWEADKCEGGEVRLGRLVPTGITAWAGADGAVGSVLARLMMQSAVLTRGRHGRGRAYSVRCEADAMRRKKKRLWQSVYRPRWMVRCGSEKRPSRLGVESSRGKRRNRWQVQAGTIGGVES